MKYQREKNEDLRRQMIEIARIGLCVYAQYCREST